MSNNSVLEFEEKTTTKTSEEFLLFSCVCVKHVQACFSESE